MRRQVASNRRPHRRAGQEHRDAAFAATAGELDVGRDVAIAGSASSASVTARAANGRNPATGETIQIAASRAAKFSAAAVLKKPLP